MIAPPVSALRACPAPPVTLSERTGGVGLIASGGGCALSIRLMKKTRESKPCNATRSSPGRGVTKPAELRSSGMTFTFVGVLSTAA
jgi:hypothetical protein